MKSDEELSEAARKRADDIFRAAMDLESEPERAAYVAEACASDAALRREVDALGEALEASETYFGDVAPSQVSAEDLLRAMPELPETLEEWAGAAGVDAEAGKTLGPYTILRRIGEGGAGHVYLAEQSRPIRRRVALKVIKLGMDTKSVIARFEAERQALAMMDHPNIAHVYDAGETEEGRPFFVMEWVRGERITAYCDEHRLDIPARLELFIQVCQAIQHAHQKGIVHRDIKPTNILVRTHDGPPRPMVIDFGIAKSMSGEWTGGLTFHGAPDLLIGTPAYMSPEQAGACGGDIDTRGDIYSLGMLLYELLTGETAFGAKELLADGVDGMRRILREREPARPSVKLRQLSPGERQAVAANRRADAGRLSALLSGELDWIVAKAIEKDRVRRYETAAALALDVGRFLRNEPIEARPPSRGYRFRKMILRNRAASTAIGALLAVLIAGFVTSTSFWLKEREARHRAVVAERRAEEALQNEAMLRQRAETRQKIALAAAWLNGGQPQAADQVMRDLPSEGPSIEAAAVLRALARWQASRGADAEAIERYRRLFAAHALDDWTTRSNDWLAGAALMAKANEAGDYEVLRSSMLARAGDTMPAPAAARWLSAVLLRPADASVLAAVQPLAARVASQGGPDIPESSTALEWRSLKLAAGGTGGPHELRAKGDHLEFVMSGEDIWNARDSFVFAYQRVAGNFDLQMRVRSIDASNPFARVGLMARNSLDDAGSRHVMVAVNADNTFQVLARPKAGSWTISLPPNPLPPAWKENSWVRLQREGSVFRGYISDNGRDWELLDSYDSASGSDGPFVDPVYVGLAGCSHSRTETATARISDVGEASALSNDALLAQALLHYRRADDETCAAFSRRCLSHPGFTVPRTAILRLLLAMSEWRLGNREIALGQLEQAAGMVGSGPAAGREGDDWNIAQALLAEAEAIMRR